MAHIKTIIDPSRGVVDELVGNIDEAIAIIQKPLVMTSGLRISSGSLIVSGGFSLSGSLFVSGGLTVTGVTILGGTVFAPVLLEPAPQNILSISGGLNVAAGTTVLQDVGMFGNLSVTGSGYITNGIFVSGTSNIAKLYIPGGLFVSGAANLFQLFVSGASTFSSGLNILGNSSFSSASLNVSGGMYVTGTVTFTSSSTFISGGFYHTGTLNYVLDGFTGSLSGSSVTINNSTTSSLYYVTGNINLGHVNNSVVLADGISGSLYVYLPDATIQSGTNITVKKIDSTGNSIYVVASGSQTIDGIVTKEITNQYVSLYVISYLTKWFIL